MNMSVLLEVAIGLVALYFLLATACSFLLEALHSVTNVRGKAMKVFLIEMVNGAASGSVESWLRKFLAKLWDPNRKKNDKVPPSIDLLDHPLLQALKKPAVWLSGKSTDPSYVPSHLISQTLLDEILKRFGRFFIFTNQAIRDQLLKLDATQFSAHPGIEQAFNELLFSANDSHINIAKFVDALAAKIKAANPAEVSAICTELANTLDNIAGKLDASELKGSLLLMAKLARHHGPGADLVKLLYENLPVKELSFEIIQSIVRAGVLPESLARSLQSILNASNYDLKQLSLGVERWYDSVMERATGWFKRHSIVLLGSFAFVFAMLFNLDSFSIAKQLFDKPALRENASELATQLVASGDSSSNKIAPMILLARRARLQQWDETDLARLSPDAVRERAREAVLLTLRKPSTLAPSLLLLQPPGNTAEARVHIAWLACGKDRPSSAVATEAVAADAQLAKTCPEYDQTLPRTDQCLFLSDALYSWDGELTKASCELFRQADIDQKSSALAAWKSEISRFLLQTKVIDESFLQTVKLIDDIAPIWELGKQKSWWSAAKDRSLLQLGSVSTRVLLLLLVVQLVILWNWPCTWNNLLFLVTIPWAFSVWIWHLELGVALLPSLAGWLMTALMVSFGAPFWFDLLNKLVNRRASGPKPAASEGAES
jgi:hypothetical protein